MKKFFSVTPLQPVSNLKAVNYVAKDNKNLENGMVTRFPILVAVNGYVEKGEEICFLCVWTDTENAVYNHQLFKEEVRKLSEKMGFYYTIKLIETSPNEGRQTQIDLFTSLIDAFKGNDDLYACLTFGTKPTSTVVMMAMNFAYKLTQNTHVSAVIYGAMDHTTNEAFLYDISSLFYIDSIVNSVSSLNIDNAKEKVKKLLQLDSEK